MQSENGRPEVLGAVPGVHAWGKVCGDRDRKPNPYQGHALAWQETEDHGRNYGGRIRDTPYDIRGENSQGFA